MTIKIKRDKRQVFTGDSFVMTSTVLIKVEDNRLTYAKPITSKSQTFLTKAIAEKFCSLRYFFLFPLKQFNFKKDTFMNDEELKKINRKLTGIAILKKLFLV